MRQARRADDAEPQRRPLLVVPPDGGRLVQRQIAPTRGRAHALPHFQRRDGMSIRKYGGRYWALYDDAGELICVCVYRKGAAEVLRRLAASRSTGATHANPQQTPRTVAGLMPGAAAMLPQRSPSHATPQNQSLPTLTPCALSNSGNPVRHLPIRSINFPYSELQAAGRAEYPTPAVAG